MAVVADTNVLIVANGKSEQASPDCVIAAITALETAKGQQVVVVDSGLRIFNEYFRYASLSGQPGLGDVFLKWLWNNQANSDRCEQVNITPLANDPDTFEEFPNDPDLAAFDLSDRKFVAVACASANNPTLLNATDTDWWDFRIPLSRNGLVINFLCPELMKE